jgi:hypothetical protein
LPRELKKEGSDWVALFNPKVKKVLDVDLVHTLVHDSYVRLWQSQCFRSSDIADKICFKGRVLREIFPGREDTGDWL